MYFTSKWLNTVHAELYESNTSSLELQELLQIRIHDNPQMLQQHLPNNFCYDRHRFVSNLLYAVI